MGLDVLQVKLLDYQVRLNIITTVNLYSINHDTLLLALHKILRHWVLTSKQNGW